MKRNRIFALFAAAALAVTPLQSAQAAIGKKAMVVTADPHATRAALEVLERGGNAVDAAVAAQWVLNVVEPYASGLGGGGFFLYYEAQTQRLYAFDGREAAPAEAFPEMFLDENGLPLPFRPNCNTGGLPVGVPGTLKLLEEVQGRFGSKRFSFAQLFEPAIFLAEKGFPVSPRLNHYMDQEKDRLRLFRDSRKVFLDKNGNPLPVGKKLVQKDLAGTFRMIQKEGVHVFYEGKLAREITAAVRKAPYHPGFMKAEDLAYYRVNERDPVRGSYRGFDLFSMGPPSSGGTTLIETLQILERYQMASHGRNPSGIHLFIEAQKLAFQDRNRFLGDSDFTKVPLAQLLSKQFALGRAKEINFQSALPTTEAAARPLRLESPHTSHLSVVDEHGNMVAFTTTIEDIFGSALMVPGRGFFLNNELTDFDLAPRNEKKELMPNAPEGEKRPRSSMSPTFVFREGKPVLVVGSPGGSRIIGIVLNVLVNFMDFGMPLSDAVSAPRVINRNGATEFEPELFENAYLRRELERRGHPILNSGPVGNVQAIAFDPQGEYLEGVSDPRGEGEAMGY